MSVPLEGIEIPVRATDEASEVFRQVSKTAQSSMGEIEDSARRVQQAHEDLNSGLKDVVTGFSGVATSAFALYNAYDRVQDMQVSVDRANLTVKTSLNAVEDAQTRLNAAIEKYGADSPQAQAASEDLKLAQERYEVAVERAQMMQGNLNETMVQSALTVIPTVITAITSLTKAKEGIDAVTKALGILKGAEGIEGVSGALSVLSGSGAGGLGGLASFIGSAAFLAPVALGVAAIAGIALAAINARNSLSDLQLQMNAEAAAAQNVANATTALNAALANGSITAQQYNDILAQVQQSTAETYGTAASTPAPATTTPTPATTTSTPTTVTMAPVTTSSAAAGGGGGGTKVMVMQEGGFGIVEKPTLFLAGERGPESYAFSPLGKGIPSGQLTIYFNPTIHSGPVYGVRGIRELSDVLWDEFNKRIRNELKSRTMFLEAR